MTTGKQSKTAWPQGNNQHHHGPQQQQQQQHYQLSSTVTTKCCFKKIKIHICEKPFWYISSRFEILQIKVFRENH